MSVSSVPSAAGAGRKWRGKRAALLTPAAVVVEQEPAEGAGLPGGQDLREPAARSADMSEPELVEPAGFWPDDEAPAPGAVLGFTNVDISGAPRRRRITGQYSADEVRALPGELVSIESTLTPGRFLCTWLESEPGAADEPRRLDGSQNGGDV